MNYNYYDDFNNQLKDLQEEEADLERYLYQNINSLDNNEIQRIKSQIAGIRNTQEQLNYLISGGFY